MTRSALMNMLVAASFMLLASLPARGIAGEAADSMLLPFDVEDSLASPYGEPMAEGDLTTMRREMAADRAADQAEGGGAAQSVNIPLLGFVPEGDSKEFMQGFHLCPHCSVVVPRQPTYAEEMAKADAALNALKHVEELKDQQKKGLIMPVASEEFDDIPHDAAAYPAKKINFHGDGAEPDSLLPVPASATTTASGPSALEADPATDLDVTL